MSETVGTVGRFGVHGTPGLEVVERATGLHLRFPGAPDWLDSRLEVDGDDVFRAVDGPLRGAPVRFTRAEDGAIAQLSLGGAISFPPHPDPNAPPYLLAPPRAPSAERDRAFAGLFDRCVRAGSSAALPYDLAYPRHEFLAYLCEEHGLFVHGSNSHEIEFFEPRGQTLGPTLQRSQLAVSACADGIWAMAYAILDRTRLRGSFHNGVLPLRVGDRAQRLYQFSIHAPYLELEPSILVEGTVYILPSESFELVTDGPTGPNSLEYASKLAVAPLARLAVGPRDFPLRFHGHDDSMVLRSLDHIDHMTSECAEAEPLDDGYRLTFQPRRGLADDLAELCAIYRRFFPWATATLEFDGPDNPAVVCITGSAGLRERLGNALARASSAQARR